MIEQDTTSDLHDDHATTSSKKLLSKPVALIQLIVFSAIGLVMFFVPFTIGEKSTILFDHGATYLVTQQHTLSVTLLFLLSSME